MSTLPQRSREEPELRSMTVAQIKAELRRAGISTRGLSSKSDFIRRYLDAQEGKKVTHIPTTPLITTTPSAPIAPTTPAIALPKFSLPPLRTTFIPNIPSPSALDLSAITKAKMEKIKFGLLSGPVNWYYFKGFDRDFHFLGDVHFSKNKNCEKPPVNVSCLRFTPFGISYAPTEFCYDLTFLLRSLFRQAVQQEEYIDFFLEFAFSLPGTEHHIDQIAKKLHTDPTAKAYEVYNKSDYLKTLYLLFYPCFQRSKKECEYSPYVRFHYADIRDIRTPKEFPYGGIEPIILEQLPYMMILHMKALITTGLRERLRETRVDALSKNLHQLLIENAELIYYFLEGMALPFPNLSLNIFYSYIVSQNFSNDYKQLMDALIPDTMLNQYIPGTGGLYLDHNVALILKNFKHSINQMTVKRNGKILHRIGGQLDSLRKDNILISGQNIADLIEQFAVDSYNEIKPSYSAAAEQFNNTILRPLRTVNTLLGLDELLIAIDYFPSLLDPSALLMDIYTLARMFRRFTGKPHVESKIVLTYTGDAHTKNYVRFFMNYLNFPLLKYHDHVLPTGQYSQCLADPKFSEYFHLPS